MKKFLALIVTTLTFVAAATAQDVRISAITSPPTSGCNLSAPYTISVIIENIGSTTVNSPIPVNYKVNNAVQANEFAPVTLAPGQTATYNFTAQYTFAPGATYNIKAATALPGDVNPANDEHVGVNFTNYALSVGGTATASQTTICTGSSNTITLSGNTGNITRWESSVIGDFSDAVTEASAGTSTSPSFSPTVTTTYRAVVQNGVCSQSFSSTPTITVDAAASAGVLSGAATYCVTGPVAGTLTVTGGSMVDHWESSADNFATAPVNEGNAGSFTFNYSGLTNTTYYRAVVISGTTCFAKTNTQTITVDPASVGGTTSPASATICTGGSSTITLSGKTGNITQWESSVIGDFSDVVVETAAGTSASPSFSPTVTTTYRAVVTSGSCTLDYSSLSVINVDAASVAGTLTPADHTSCGTDAGTIALSGNTGSTIKWEVSTDNGVTYSLFGTQDVVSNAYSIAMPSVVKYRTTVTNGTCAAATPTIVTYTVDAPSVAGTISGSSQVCTGSNLTLTLSGQTGTVTNWEVSTDGGATYTTVPGSAGLTSITVTPTVNSQYHAIVQSGIVCAAATTADKVITVDATTMAGTITPASHAICVSESGTLVLSGYIGSSIQWQSSADNATFTNGGTASTEPYSVTATTYFRAFVQNGSCPAAFTPVVKYTISPASNAGTVTAASPSVCFGGSDVLTATGTVGTVTTWESSTDGFVTTTAVAGSAGLTSITVTPTTTTQYRIVVQSGICAAATSAAVTVTIDATTQGGQVSSPVTHTACGTETGTLTLINSVGTILRWESSTDNFATIVTNENDGGSTTHNYSLTNTGSTAFTTSYRAVVQSGACAVKNSDGPNVMITLDPTTVAGTVSGSASVCATANTGTVTLSGNTGAVTNWEFSTDGGATWTTVTPTNTSTSLTYTNLTTTTEYRAVVQSGTCLPASSTFATITVAPATVAGTVTDAGTGTATASYCSLTNSGTLNLAGNTGTVSYWESSTDNFATAGTTIANTTNSLAYSNSNVSGTVYYRAYIQSGACTGVYSNIANVTGTAPSNGGTVTPSNTTVCTGTNGGTLTLSGITGSIVRWESSTDNFGTNIVPVANTTSSLTFSNLTVSTNYRVVVQSGTCPIAYSTTGVVTVSGTITAGTTSGATTVCSGTNSGSVILTGNSGTVTNWEYSLDNFATAGTAVSPANTTTTQSYLNITATTSYRALLTNGGCTATSPSVTVTVDQPSVGGTAKGDTTYCTASSAGAVTISGNMGTVTDWEMSTDNVTYTSTGTAGNTYSYPAGLTSTTYFRAVVKNGTCFTANSAPATITISSATTAGTIAAAGVTTVCSGSNSDVLTLTGNVGSVVRWESSVDGGTTWTMIANTTNSLTYTNLTQTTDYRALVQNGTCTSAFTNVVTITVTPAAVGGTINSDRQVCITSNSGTLTLSGQTGTVTQWEFSIDAGTTWTVIANTTTSQSYTNVTDTTVYRALVANGSACAAVYSATATLSPAPASVGGTLAGSTTVCGSSNSGNINLSGQTGSVLDWESSTDGGATWTIIANTTNTQLYTNLTQTTQYRANVQSADCASAFSTIATITIDVAPVGGTIAGAATVCATANGGTLTLSGQTGTIVNWETSLDNFATAGTPVSPANTTTTQTYTNLAATTSYRAIVTGTGGCGSDTSSVATITVTPANTAGTISADTTVCSPTNAGTISLTGTSGTISAWQVSTDNGATYTSTGSTTNPQSFTNLTQTSLYRAIISGGACNADTSLTSKVTVTPQAVGGALSADTTVCNGTSVTLNLSGSSGNIIRWESDVNNTFSAPTAIANTTTTYTFTAISSLYYRAVVNTSATCGNVFSTISHVTVDATSIGGTVTPATSTACSGANSGILTLSGNTGTVTGWEISTNNGVSFSAAGNAGSLTQNYLNITTSTIYHAIVQNGTCASTPSSTGTITVTPQAVGGIISGAGTVCNGSSVTLTLNGNTGNVIRWESSANSSFTPSTVIPITSTTYSFTAATSLYYQAVVSTGGACADVMSNIVNVIVTPATVAGSISATSTTLCGTTNSATLTLNGSTGSVLRWESSTDGGNTYIFISNNTTTQNISNLAQTTQFRAVVQSGNCSILTTLPITITVSPAAVGGTVNGSTTVCSGSNSGSVVLSGQTGSVTRWQSSPNGSTWTDLPANTSNTQLYNNLTATTYYRAAVATSCSNTFSSAAVITVTPMATGGSITNSSTSASQCSGSNSGLLTLAGYTGTIKEWQLSENNGFSYSTINNTANTQPYTNLTKTTIFRAVITNGTCSNEVFSSTITVTIDQASSIGIATGSATVCSGNNSGSVILTQQGSNSTVTRWESSIDNGANWAATTPPNPSTSQGYLNLTTTTSYRAVAQSGVCPSVNSNSVVITVNPAPTANFTTKGTQTGDPVVFTNTSTISTGMITSYGWIFGDVNNNTSTESNPTHIYEKDGKYTVKLTVASTNGCTSTKSVTLTISSDNTSYTFEHVTDLITANGDGVNDNFVIPGVEAYSDSDLRIYTSSGTEVFAEAPYKNDWTGDFKGESLPGGSYVYVLKFKNSDKVYKGIITLLR